MLGEVDIGVLYDLQAIAARGLDSDRARTRRNSVRFTQPTVTHESKIFDLGTDSTSNCVSSDVF
jgi:hypothetical protein